MELIIGVIKQCLNTQDLEKDIDLRTVRFVETYLKDMSVHQINDLVSICLAMGFNNFAKEIIQKIEVKDLKFNCVFKEWATNLITNQWKYDDPFCV